MKIKCMLDKKTFTQKPNGFEPSGIQKRLSQTEIGIEELANLMSNGATFKPALLNGTKSKDWASQQIFALDFDEGTTIKNELERCVELDINPVFGYKTFSYTEDKEKFRLVFCNNKVITDINIRNDFQKLLIALFPNSDSVTFDPTRLFFGGKGLIECNFDNRIDINIILNKYNNMLNNIKKNETKNNASKNQVEKKPHYNKDIPPISILSCGEKPPASHNINDENNYNIKALRNRDVKYLKGKIGNSRIILENNQAFFDYIKSYDLGLLLEIKYPSSFRCIFHNDNNPSAGIFINEEGTYIYHCFGCGISYNIINVIEVLGNFQSRPKAYKFIREIFNLEIVETEWQKEQKEILRENHRTLLDGELEKQCPEAYKNIKRNIKYLDQLFLIAEDNVYSEKFTDDEGNVIFYASTKFICNKLGMSENSATEVSKKNTLFVYHKLLNKLDDINIPEDMLKRSQAITANNENENKNQKHINFYSIPSYNTNLFKDIEIQGNQWKENQYTMKGLSREMFYRAEGLEVANKLYPQYKKVTENIDGVYQVVDRTTTKSSDKRTINIVKAIHELIDEYGYATEKDIVERLKVRYFFRTTEIQIKKSLKEILDLYSLKRIRANKEIKEQYRMTGNGYPFIIVKND